MKTLAAILLLIIIWGVGLIAFAARVEQSTPADPPPVADGIVVLTGASVVRLEEATKLLEAGKARRMLVSGVNRKVTRADIQDVTGAFKPIYDCCVDLGFQAANTVGNAHESREWARAKGYRKVIVVTADYHMPRSMLELKAAMPGVTLYPYPVRTETLDVTRWWKSAIGFRRMALEYCKYLAILAREGFLSLGPKDKTSDAVPAAPADGAAEPSR